MLSHRKQSNEELISFSMHLRVVGLFNCCMFSDHVLQTQNPTNRGALHALEKGVAGSFGSSKILRPFKLQGSHDHQLEILI